MLQRITFTLLCLAAFLAAAPLKVTSAPADGAEVSLMKPNWREAVATTAATKRDKTGYGPYEPQCHPEPVRFAWDGGTAPYTLDIVAESGDAPGYILCGNGPAFSVFNLHVGTPYKWTLSDAKGARISGRFRTAWTPRLINLPDRNAMPMNVRDIGGYPAMGGARVRQGLVYRGTEMTGWKVLSLADMTPTNQEVLVKGLKIRTDLDLRYPNVIAKFKASQIDPSVQWLHYAVNAYQPFTPEMNALFRDTIRVFADRRNYPIYVHCSGGADRTGEVCFLISALLGVADEDLFLDYELTSLARLPRPRKMSYFRAWLARVAAFSPGNGKGLSYQKQVENYMLGIGVTQKEIDSIRAILLQK